MAALVSIEGGRRRPSLGLTLPEMGTPEYYLWLLIIGEVLYLVWVRTAFKGAHGG